jgi:hypothetical protein
MRPDDFVDYGTKAKYWLNGKNVPYSTIKSIEYDATQATVSYRTSFGNASISVRVALFKAKALAAAKIVKCTIDSFAYPMCQQSPPGVLTQRKLQT